eukprot:352209-Chlamydomonas_euryale.AAC.3
MHTACRGPLLACTGHAYGMHRPVVSMHTSCIQHAQVDCSHAHVEHSARGEPRVCVRQAQGVHVASLGRACGEPGAYTWRAQDVHVAGVGPARTRTDPTALRRTSPAPSRLVARCCPPRPSRRQRRCPWTPVSCQVSVQSSRPRPATQAASALAEAHWRIAAAHARQRP